MRTQSNWYNFVPHPIGQAIGKAGNAAGAWVDAAQAAGDLYNGNYVSAAINAASVALPNVLANNEFRRNSKYLKSFHLIAYICLTTVCEIYLLYFFWRTLAILHSI